MKTKITLSNSFHNTEVTLIAKGGYLSRGQVRRARKALCGIGECCCGGSAGQRPDGQYGLEERQDGGAYLTELSSN